MSLPVGETCTREKTCSYCRARKNGIEIINRQNGLSKTIDIKGYTLIDIQKTISVYSAAGFKVVRYA